MSTTKNNIDIMLERGKFTANGYEFIVKPIFLGEETEYLNDVSFALYPISDEKDEFTDKELSAYAMALFQVDSQRKKQKSILPMLQRIKKYLIRKFNKRYEYYSDNPSILGLVKWIEKKVYYKNKRIRFYDLERKFKLSKAEIIKLMGYFQDISGF